MKITTTILGLLFAMGIALLGAKEVWAQTATDVVCTGCVNTTDIANGAVTSPKLANGAVTNTKLGANAVTGAKVLDASLTGADIADGSITGADISSTAALNIDSLTTTGNVGIGTTSPGYPLQVNGQARFDREVGIFAGPFTGQSLAVQAPVTAPNVIANFLDSTGTSMLVVRDTGVSIGATEPLAKLDIRAATPANKHNAQLTLYDTNALAAGVGGVINFGGIYTDSTITEFGGIGAFKDNATDGNHGGYLSLFSRTHNSPIGMEERVRIDSSGNVGIGTTSPGAKLEVEGFNTWASPLLRLEAMPPFGGAVLQMKHSFDPTSWEIVAGNNADDDFSINRGISGDSKLYISGAGNVGIGTTTPAATLHVAGQVICDGGCTSSSRDLKENIRELPLEDAMAALKELRPTRFIFKPTDGEEVGFIAEDAPELVAKRGRKGLDAMDIVAVLTKVVQEQQRQIEELKAHLAARN